MRELFERVRYVHASDGWRLAMTELVSGTLEQESACFLLIHGFAQNRGSFFEGGIPRALLARGARVFLGELRGHGRSDPGHDLRPWSLTTHLDEDLPTMIDHARDITGNDRVHLVGHSLGGMLGYACLARTRSLASLTTFAAPVVLGRDRPLVRALGMFVHPLVKLAEPRSVRIDRVLSALAPLLSTKGARGSTRLLQEVTKLVNPDAADPRTLEKLLLGAEPEASLVFAELAAMAARGRATIDGIDLAEAVRASEIPIAAVLGTRDVFASRASVDVISAPGARGPRLILEVPGASHVDLTVGEHAPQLISRLWDFLIAS